MKKLFVILSCFVLISVFSVCAFAQALTWSGNGQYDVVIGDTLTIPSGFVYVNEPCSVTVYDSNHEVLTTATDSVRVDTRRNAAAVGGTYCVVTFNGTADDVDITANVLEAGTNNNTDINYALFYNASTDFSVDEKSGTIEVYRDSMWNTLGVGDIIYQYETVRISSRGSVELSNARSVVDNITDLFSEVGSWISDTIPKMSEMFYVNDALTPLGIMCVMALGIGIILLFVLLIMSWLKFR